MKRKIKLVIFLLVFCVSFSPVSIPPVKYSQAIDSDSIKLSQEWFTNQTIDKNLTIEEGATLTVHEGVTLTFAGGEINVFGKLILKGTVEKPVKTIKAEDAPYYSINVFSGGSLLMRNADISGSGEQMLLLQGNPFINLANATSSRGAIYVFGGFLDARGCSFHDNVNAIVVDSTNPQNVVVNRSQFFNNSQRDVVYDSGSAAGSVDFRFNWWGKPDGPKKICAENSLTQFCYYEKVYGSVDFSNWLTSRNFRDPVVIVPGVFGSQKENGIWKIDPVFHIYDNLIESLEKNGYAVGKDLFIFPYDWRNSNVENAVRLRYEIAEIKAIANWPKVDIVAHSMGGLLARQYIESSEYRDDIDQLITLGTPNKGAPEIYPLWEAGKSIGIVQTGMKKFLEQEMKEAGYSDMFDYIRKRPIYSARELLPTYEYLYDLEAKRPLIYPNEYPFNQFLDSLNSQDRLRNLAKVEYTKVVGNVSSNQSTISGFEVMRTNLGKIWEHGYPISFEIPVIGDRGALHDEGDGTVPLVSGKSLEVPADNYIELNSSHIDLPTKAQEDVLKMMTGYFPSSTVNDSMIKNMLQVFVHSPIDIQIISPSGDRVGKDFETGEILNEIEGAFYAGYKDENGDEIENEFVTIPNPEEGEYRILTQRTGSGGYRVEAVNISENENDSLAPIESVANFKVAETTGDGKEFKMNLEGTEIIGDFETPKDSTAPTTEIEVSGAQGSADWMKEDAMVKLTAVDNEGGSGIDKTQYSLDNGSTWLEYSQPFSISQEGSTVVQYFSSDKEGNAEETKSKTIKIDKSSPEAKIAFNPSAQKFEIKGIDNLSQNVAVVIAEQPKAVSPKEKERKIFNLFADFFQKLKQEKDSKQKNLYTATLTDEAGNVTNVIFEKKRDENHRIDLLISSVAYNGIGQDLQATSLKYKWVYNDKKKTYAMLAQSTRTSEAFVEAHYRPKKNVTIIMQKAQELDERDEDDDCDFRPTKQKLPGLVIVGLQTEKGKVKISY